MVYSFVLDVLVAAITSVSATNDSIQKIVNLDEVKVTSSYHKITDQGGKIVYNVYLEKVRTEVSTADLMRKVPMVSVDMNGNLSIRGNNHVKILVNGHSPGILMSNQVLEQIPPADIQKIEVMAVPSAKYEAQGTGGVVNIITNRKMYFKTSGYLNVGLGSKGSHLMGNFNYAIDRRWTLQNSFYNLLGYSSTSSNSNFSGSSDGRNWGYLYSWQSGLSYNTDKSMFNLNIQYLYQGTTYKETKEAGQKQKTNNGYHYLGSVIGYSYAKSEKLKLDAQARSFYLPTSSTMENDNNWLYKAKSHILGQMAQVDLNWKPTLHFNVEAGLSNNYSHFNNLSQPRLVRSIDNLGVYSELKYALSPVSSFWGGVRYEYYHIDTELDRKKTYKDFFYNVGIDYKLSPFSTLSLMCSRRTDRPTFATLLDEANYQGGDVMQKGNGTIQPSYCNLLEGGFSLYMGDCFFKLSPYYKYTKHAISLIMQFDGRMVQQSSANIQSLHVFGTELWTTLNLFRGKLTFNGGLDVMHKKWMDETMCNSGWQLQYAMNATYRLSPTLYVNCYGTWQNKKVYLQGRENSYLYSNLSIQKSWHDDLYRMAISLDNPFSNGTTVRRDYHIDHLGYNSEVKFHNTGVRLFFVYKFGKHDMEKNLKVEQNILNNY